MVAAVRGRLKGLMMIKVVFFGRLSDALDTRELQLPVFSKPFTIDDVVNALAEQYGEKMLQQLNEPSIAVAVDQKACSDRNAVIDSAVEIAFFPPVTGG